MLRSKISSSGEALARWVTYAEDVDLHELEIVVKRLVLCEHLDVLVVQLELGHGVDGIDRVFLHRIVVHLLSYYVALKKGTDIDKPRNLAKSVTVE